MVKLITAIMFFSIVTMAGLSLGYYDPRGSTGAQFSEFELLDIEMISVAIDDKPYMCERESIKCSNTRDIFDKCIMFNGAYFICSPIR